MANNKNNNQAVLDKTNDNTPPDEIYQDEVSAGFGNNVKAEDFETPLGNPANSVVDIEVPDHVVEVAPLDANDPLLTLEPEDKDSAAALKAVENKTVDDLEPPKFVDSIQVSYDGPLNLVNQFVMESIGKQARGPNEAPATLETAFPKYTQTEWFSEFNKKYANTPETAGNKIFAKTNGYFYKESDTVEQALSFYGIKGDRLGQLADKFEMVYFGNTANRKKPANEQADIGSKSFVLRLKNPEAENAAELVAEVTAARMNVVERKLGKSPSIQDAQDALLGKLENIYNHEADSTGKKPFIGTENTLFLQPTAVRSRLNEIPELRGKFSVSPLSSAENKAHYLGYSEQMESFFEDDLKICKVETKDPNLMPQEELEKIVSDSLKRDNSNLMVVPKEALKMREDLASPAAKTEQPPVIAPEANAKPESTPKQESAPEKEKSSPEQPVQKRQTIQRNFDDHDEDDKPKKKEMKSLGEVAADAIANVSKEALRIALELIKLVLKMIWELLKGIFKLCTTHPKTSWENFCNYRPKWQNLKPLLPQWNNRAANDAKLEKEHSKEASEGLEKALESQSKDMAAKATVKAPGLASELQAKDLKGIDVVSMANETMSKFDDDKKAKLDTVVDKRMAKLTDEDISAHLNDVVLPAIHKVDSNLDAKLAAKTLVNDEFGVLLAKNDKVVTADGQEYGVLAANSVAGTLFYALAKEADGGNYEINHIEAKDLTLLQHNGIQFDNEENLLKQAQTTFAETFKQHEGKIEPVEILDHQNPSPDALSVKEFTQQHAFFSLSSVPVDSSPVSVVDLLESDPVLMVHAANSAPQLHTDSRDDRSIPHSGNHHPFFGELLDINDTVNFSLPNGNIAATGAIMGAYAHDNDLYYAIEANGNTYSIQAKDLELIGKNDGNLTEKQVADAKRTIFGFDIPSAHKGEAQRIALQEQNDTSKHYTFARINSDNDLVADGYSNIGVVPLEEVGGQVTGAGKLIDFRNSKNKTIQMVSIGEVIDPSSGLKRAVCMEVEKKDGELVAKPFGKNRLVQIDLDDAKVKVDANGVTSESLKNMIDVAAEMYKLASVRKVADLAAQRLPEIKDAILPNFNRHNDLANEGFIKGQILTRLLEQKAQETAPAVKIGQEANLANTTVNADQVSEAVNNPQSRQATPSQSLAGAAAVLAPAAVAVAAAEVGASTLNDFIDEAVSRNPVNVTVPKAVEAEVVQAAPVKAVEPVAEPAPVETLAATSVVAEPTPLEQAVVENIAVGPAVAHTDNVAPVVVEVDASKPAELKSEAVESVVVQPVVSNVAAMESTLTDLVASEPQDDVYRIVQNMGDNASSSRVAKFTMAYMYGEYRNNADGAIDLARSRENLAEQRAELMAEAKELSERIANKVDGIVIKDGVVDFHMSKINEPEKLQAALRENHELALKAEVLVEEFNFHAAEQRDHAKNVVDAFEKMGRDLHVQSVKPDQYSDISRLSDAVIADLQHDDKEVQKLGEFVSVVDKAAKEQEFSYGETMLNVSQKNTEFNQAADERVSTLKQAFNPAKKVPRQGNDKNNDNDLTV